MTQAIVPLWLTAFFPALPWGYSTIPHIFRLTARLGYFLAQTGEPQDAQLSLWKLQLGSKWVMDMVVLTESNAIRVLNHWSPGPLTLAVMLESVFQADIEQMLGYRTECWVTSQCRELKED